MKAPSGDPNYGSTYEKGVVLEQRVAAAYRLLGADPVLMNLRLVGHQLDVYVEVLGADGFPTRIGIECKNYDKSVGVNEVSAAAQKLHHLRQSGKIDLPVIVSANRFTPEALSAAQALGVKTITLADLLRRVEDFSGYLSKSAQDYEASKIYSKSLYRQLRCNSESGKDLGFIDEYVPAFFAKGGRFLTILGDYGTGKTTFAQRLLWASSKAYLADPLANRIPVFVPLKRYRKEVNIRSLIMDLLLHDYGIRIKDYTTFKALNEQGRLLLILDAFDEMATGAEEGEIISNFRELRSLVLERSLVILTCRTHFFKDQDQLKKVHSGTSLYRELEEGDKPYELCSLLSFSEEDVIALVHKYEPSRATEYLSVIDSTYNLKELSRHPILLDMIMTTVPEVLKGSTLVTPSDLYSTYTGFWLDRDDWRTRMTHDQREFFMKELALHFLFNSISEIWFRDLPKHIKQKFPGLRTFRDLDYFEADIRTCTFLVRDPRGYYSFVHRSFAEYFAAKCILDHLLAGRWPDYLWKGRGHGVTGWITPEASRFIIDLVDKKQSFDFLTGLFFRPHLVGSLLVIILAIYRHSTQPEHRYLFDVAYALYHDKMLAGVDFRGQIADMAEKLHTQHWRQVKEAMESESNKDGLFKVFKNLHQIIAIESQKTKDEQ